MEYEMYNEIMEQPISLKRTIESEISCRCIYPYAAFH